jgi:hypothetical protein
MHKVEETRYGYKVTFEGFLHRDDMGALLNSMKEVVRPRHDREERFAVLVDMRNSRAFPSEAQELLKQAITLFKEAGMERNAVVLNSAIATLQARRLAKETNTAAWSRFIDASSETDWERVAVEWLLRAVEPQRAFN